MVESLVTAVNVAADATPKGVVSPADAKWVGPVADWQRHREGDEDSVEETIIVD